MPYKIVKDNDKYCVVKVGDSKPLGCHDTKEDAESQIQAIIISERNIMSKDISRNLTINNIDDNIFVEGYLFRYGDSNDTDLHKQYWTPETYLMQETFPVKGVPITFAHSEEDEFTKVGIGIVNFVKQDEIGLFIKGQLNKREKWKQIIREISKTRKMNLTEERLDELANIAFENMKQLVLEVPLQWSMGSYPPTYLADKNSGVIERAGIVEAALTPVPAEPNGTEARFTFKSILNLKEYETIEDKESNTKNKKQINKGIKMEEEKELELEVEEEKEPNFGEDVQKAMDEFSEKLYKMVDEEMSKRFSSKKPNRKSFEDFTKRVASKTIEKDSGYRKAVSNGENLKSVVEEILNYNQENIIKETVKSFLVEEQKSLEKAQKSIKNVFDDFVGEDEETSKSAGGFTMSKEDRNAAAGRIEFVKEKNTWQKNLYEVWQGRTNPTSDYQKNMKAQNPYIGTLGGVLVGQEMSDQILDPLRPEVVTFNAGVTETRVNGIGIYTRPKMTTVPSAYRPGINDQVTETQAKYDSVSAFLRPLACRIVIPRQQLMQTSTNMEEQIRREIVRSLRLQIDKEVLEGVGAVTGTNNTGAEIRGVKRVLNDLLPANVVQLATNGRKPKYEDLINAETQIAEADVELDDNTSAFIMHPRDRGTFRRTFDANGQPLLYTNVAEKPYQDLVGYRVFTTTQIDNTQTVGTSSDCSDIYFGNWRYAEYVIGNDIEIILDDMTLADKLQVRFIAYLYSDLIIHYPEAFYIMSGVRS